MTDAIDQFTPEELDFLIKNIDQLAPHERTEVTKMVDALAQRTAQKTAQHSFLSFMSTVEPSLLQGPQHKIIGSAFERIANGTLKRLIIAIAPRHSKSTMASYMFPAWFLGKFPQKKVIMASHTGELAVDFGRKVRNLIASPIYGSVFPGVSLAADSKAAGRWNTSHQGEYFALGVGAAMAGRGGDLVIIDDPFSEQEARSGNPAVYDSVYEWFMGGPRQRLQPGGAIIVLATRWNKRDLSGRLIENMIANPDADQWEVIELPAILPSGQPLWPEFWPLEELLKVKHSIDPRYWQAQYMQALALDTPVPTPTGWTTMQDLQVGDYVLGVSGNPVKVVGKSNIFKNRPSYRVVSDDGAEVIADEDHLWTVKLRRNDGPFKTYTTKYLADRFPVGSQRKPRPPEVLAWDLPAADLEVEPYVLGVWLGDGTRRTASITAHEDDQPYLRAELERLGYPTTVWATPQSFGVLGNLRQQLRDAGVYENKHVPEKYLRGSIEQRVALLQGLMDTDGSVQNGQACFANTNELLADAVYELVLSLGGKPFKSTFKPKNLKNKICFRIHFYLDNAFRMPRKADKARLRKTRIGRFLAFEPVGAVDTVCIRVDAEDGLFLAGRGCIPTHNSPTSEEGAIIKREWWRPWMKPEPPVCDYLIGCLDAAAETNNNSDHTSLTIWGVFYQPDEATGELMAHIILLESIRERIEFPELKALTYKTYKDWKLDTLIVEKKSNGVALYQELRRAGIPVQEFTPTRATGDKTARLNAVADIVRSGLVWYPHGKLWAEELIDEVAGFPSYGSDDRVDTTSMALARFRNGGFIRLPTDREFDDEPFVRSVPKYY